MEKLAERARISCVRPYIDHIEQIIEWFEQEGYECKIMSEGIDGEFKYYENLANLLNQEEHDQWQ